MYGYYDETADFYEWGSNISNSHIEATHYISERKFLEKFPDSMEDWNEMSREEPVNIGEQQMYHCASDFHHKTDYYSDQKPLSVFAQIDYVRYCDGEILQPLYSMMGK